MAGLLEIFALLVGAIVGSFLNACIYRLPLGISLNQPKRSFCPHCQTTIPWYHNLPLISWLLLRGRCAHCAEKIPFRYFLVELLTALSFWALWRLYELPLAPVYWLLFSLLIAATFIDIDHLIIPDEITWGGTAAGLCLSFFVPAMMGVETRAHSIAVSLGSAVLGFLLLWMVVELGKLAFGRKIVPLDEPQAFRWERSGDSARLQIGEDSLAWEEIFSRETDELVLDCHDVSVEGAHFERVALKFRYNVLILPEKQVPLETMDAVAGKVSRLVIPREAMGFGDVKFIALIGAFLGWQAVVFTIFASSVIGCIYGVGKLLAPGGRGAQIPYGPFLALGAAWWLLGGQQIWHWYFGLFER